MENRIIKSYSLRFFFDAFIYIELVVLRVLPRSLATVAVFAPARPRGKFRPPEWQVPVFPRQETRMDEVSGTRPEFRPTRARQAPVYP